MGTLEKIKDIEAEIARTQKNKATEHHLGTLKAKLANLKREVNDSQGGSVSDTSKPTKGNKKGLELSSKKTQRTKGNTQPSSSSRSAKFLQNEGQAFISFDTLTSQQDVADGGSLDGELKLLLRKMAKKDTVTKLKAIQEFTLLCKEKDGEMIKVMLNFWPRMYNKLAHDFDHRVRESTQLAHYQLTTKAGRNLAPHLKQVIVNWLLSLFDNHPPAATNARLSFCEVFQEGRRKEVLSFCKSEILQACEKNILRETMDTLSDPKVVSLEEREAKYNRFISSSLQLLKYIMENLSIDDDAEDPMKENFNILFNDKKFWKFSKFESPMVQASFFTLISTCCSKLTELLGQHVNNMAAVLTCIDIQDPIVTKALWELILLSLSTYDSIWQFVNVRKAVWPKLWKLLKAGCYGNIIIVYPNLLPFLSNIPSEVAGEGTGFYSEFFNNLAEVLVTKEKTLSEEDMRSVVSTYMESVRYLLVTHVNNKELCDFLVWTVIADSLHNIFHSAEGRCHTWHAVFIEEIHSLLSYTHLQHLQNNENNEFYKTLYTDLWRVISAVIFIESSNDIRFKFIKSENDAEYQVNFYQSLMLLLSCCCKDLSGSELGDGAPSSAVDNGIHNNVKQEAEEEEEEEEQLWIFIHNVVKSYNMEIFNQNQYHVGEQLVKLILLSFNIRLIKFVCKERLRSANNSNVLDENASDLVVCKTFINSIVLPLLNAGVEYEREIIELTIGFVRLLHGSDKEEYLICVFERDLFSGCVLLVLFVEVLKHYEDEFVLKWLKSEYVEVEVTKLCTFCSEDNDNSTREVNLKWQVLQMYILIVNDNPDKVGLYHDKLLVLIKYYIESSEEISENMDAVLSTFSSLCTPSFEPSGMFLETLFVIFRYNVLHVGRPCSLDAMKKGFVKLMQNHDITHFNAMVSKLIPLITDFSSKLVCSQLCFVLCFVVQLAHNHSNEISYGKIMLESIFQRNKEELLPVENGGTLKGDKKEALQVEKEDKGDKGELFGVDNEDCKEVEMIKFYSIFLKTLAGTNISVLQSCEATSINVILKCIDVGSGQENILENIKDCIKSCEFIHFALVNETIDRCLKDSATTGCLKTLLGLLLSNGQLSESILDDSLMLASPAQHNYTTSACETYSTIVMVLDDISSVRALVEMYIDEFQNNSDLSGNANVCGPFLKVLSSVISRWCDILKASGDDLEDYYDVIYIVMNTIVQWKEIHCELVLFSCSVEKSDASILSLNIELITLLCLCVETALQCFKAQHWDFLLCSMISWLQTCEQSLDSIEKSLNCSRTESYYLPLMYISLKLFNMIACVFDPLTDSVESTSMGSTAPDVSPCIYVRDASSMSPVILNEDTVSEWKELFLPTTGTSLLHIYTRMMNSCHSGIKVAELEEMICSCIRFLPPYAINDFLSGAYERGNVKDEALHRFCEVACRLLSNGRWWCKISSYQLLTKLGELIEVRLCYVSQEEDEEHEGMRSFPKSLIQTMEHSRDETLKKLSTKQVSIKEPLQGFEDAKGKSELLTYLLSWQLILQLFKMADASNRAMFANYFRNNSDIHDLLTCLFCIMPQSANLQNKGKIVLSTFAFSEIRQVAFHLLTTAMQCIPALVRNWFNNHINRVDTGTVNKFVSNYISPYLLKKEFQKLNDSSKEFNNMVVKTRCVAREIAAIYTVDEVSMELVVELGPNHPLAPVSVSCGKRIGVSNALWRQWMLQLNNFLSFQNGSILDGLVLWKRNVDKRFEGVEECMVCFSVLHGSNYSLPSIACKTCHKKFHPACLYKWFNTSGKCTCPLCREIF